MKPTYKLLASYDAYNPLKSNCGKIHSLYGEDPQLICIEFKISVQLRSKLNNKKLSAMTTEEVQEVFRALRAVKDDSPMTDTMVYKKIKVKNGVVATTCCTDIKLSSYQAAESRYHPTNSGFDHYRSKWMRTEDFS